MGHARVRVGEDVAVREAPAVEVRRHEADRRVAGPRRGRRQRDGVAPVAHVVVDA